ncbi:MAG: hypothetical protein M1835_000969 [Candelina submexicana]|nr:MAG: hypothetical protein M1835_000969 [Candelina submexicana]
MRNHPRLVLTSDDPDFDRESIQHWKDEGFDVSYLLFKGDAKSYERTIQRLADDLELGEKYAIVAYGLAASHALYIAQKPLPKLSTLIAYYPTKLPASSASSPFPPSLAVQVHLAGTQPFAPKYSSYNYPHAEPGFAEHDDENFDGVDAGLAWTRALGLVRKGFGIDMKEELESAWQEHLALEFQSKDASATMATMTSSPSVTHVPTLTGGITYADLHRFYADFFIPSNPLSFRTRLLSRTVGVDRIVDELLVKFRHTQEMDWILPGVETTDKEVEVVLVCVVGIRGGKLVKERIYWDQASVLVQVGLLDKGNLPVVGSEGARAVVDEESVEFNGLIPDW